MEYLADYHVHSRWSPDARYPMADMARAGAEAGLRELCFTDHVEVISSGSTVPNTFDFKALSAEFDAAEQAVAGRMLLRRGIELGEAPRDFGRAEELERQAPPLDFIIGSQHQIRTRRGWEDLYFAAARDAKTARRQIADYLELVLSLASWGKFSVLGHLTLPLRYMNENRGLSMTFDGFESEVSDVFRALIANGCGIEVNTNRGHDPLPGEKWLRLYRALGGELVTLGSDAHAPESVGCCIARGQALLRGCGFTRFCTFDRLRPVFHAL